MPVKDLRDAARLAQGQGGTVSAASLVSAQRGRRWRPAGAATGVMAVAGKEGGRQPALRGPGKAARGEGRSSPPGPRFALEKESVFGGQCLSFGAAHGGHVEGEKLGQA